MTGAFRQSFNLPSKTEREGEWERAGKTDGWTTTGGWKIMLQVELSSKIKHLYPSEFIHSDRMYWAVKTHT